MKLILRNRAIGSIEVGLYNEPIKLTMSFNADETPYVASDREYRIELIGSPTELSQLSMATFSLNVNGLEIPAYAKQQDERLFLVPYYADEEKAKRFDRVLLFMQAFGFVQIEIKAVGPNIHKTFYSDYLQVALRESQASQDLKAMAKYIADRKEWFGETKQDEVSNADLDEAKARLRYFEKAIRTYESQFVFFSTHAKTRTKEIYRREGYEKLRNFDAKTLNYVMTHPEELTQVRSNSGIAIGGYFYAPKHTLVSHRTSTKETPENRSVMAFLVTLEKTLGCFREELTIAAKATGLSSQLPEGYVSSTDVMFDTMRKDWINLFNEVGKLLEKLTKIRTTYTRILFPVSEPLLSQPAPTPVFMSEPHYRLIYELMAEGFNMRPLILNSDQRLMLKLLSSRLYEFFTLANSIEQLLKEGFRLQEAFHFKYALADTLTYYHDVDFANTFVFRKGKQTITLYYQPIISGKNGGHENGIHLKRITSMSLREKESLTGVYVPDLVMKSEEKELELYYIADAKYSALETAKERYAKEVAFRYLFSIRPTIEKAMICGLFILYGKRSEGDQTEVDLLDLLNPNDENQLPTFSIHGIFPTLNK